MFEVIPHPRGGWRWQFISATGRPLVYSNAVFSTQLEAKDAACAFRAAFFAVAATIDCSQYKGSGRCHKEKVK